MQDYISGHYQFSYFKEEKTIKKKTTLKLITYYSANDEKKFTIKRTKENTYFCNTDFDLDFEMYLVCFEIRVTQNPLSLKPIFRQLYNLMISNFHLILYLYYVNTAFL